MKFYLLSSAIILLFTTYLSSQTNSVSVYVGGQIPTEVALLDLNGNGPDDVFKSGPAVGFILERRWKNLNLSADFNFSSNRLKDEWTGDTATNFEGDLYNFYTRTILGVNVISRDSKPILSFGLGPGVIIGSVPATTYFSDLIDGGGNFSLDRRTEISLALCSSLRINIPLSERLSIQTSLNNDFIVYYADIESVVYSNLNIGITKHF